MINSKTICAVGCLMSSISMMLAGHQIAVPGSGGANPGTLNAWLRANKGYDGRDDLEEDAIPRLAPGRVQWGAHGMHRANDVSREAALQLLRAGQPVIANVLAGHHFVLVVGVDAHDPDILYVNDPGFSTTARAAPPRLASPSRRPHPRPPADVLAQNRGGVALVQCDGVAAPHSYTMAASIALRLSRIST